MTIIDGCPDRDWCAFGLINLDLDDNGSFESGQQCLEDYIAQQGALMGTSGQPAMTALTGTTT